MTNFFQYTQKPAPIQAEEANDSPKANVTANITSLASLRKGIAKAFMSHVLI